MPSPPIFTPRTPVVTCSNWPISGACDGQHHSRPSSTCFLGRPRYSTGELPKLGNGQSIDTKKAGWRKGISDLLGSGKGNRLRGRGGLITGAVSVRSPSRFPSTTWPTCRPSGATGHRADLGSAPGRPAPNAAGLPASLEEGKLRHALMELGEVFRTFPAPASRMNRRKSELPKSPNSLRSESKIEDARANRTRPRHDPRPSTPSSFLKTPPLSPPLQLSSVYEFSGIEQVDAIYQGTEAGFIYARTAFPTPPSLPPRSPPSKGEKRPWSAHRAWPPRRP